MATICRYEMSKACTIGRIVRPKRNDHESQRNNQYDAQRLCKGKPGCSKLCRQSQFKNTINREVYVKHENSRINHRQVVKGLLYLNLSLVLLGMCRKSSCISQLRIYYAMVTNSSKVSVAVTTQDLFLTYTRTVASLVKSVLHLLLW